MNEYVRVRQHKLLDNSGNAVPTPMLSASSSSLEIATVTSLLFLLSELSYMHALYSLMSPVLYCLCRVLIWDLPVTATATSGSGVV